jgi:hypothetical protein
MALSVCRSLVRRYTFSSHSNMRKTRAFRLTTKRLSPIFLIEPVGHLLNKTRLLQSFAESVSTCLAVDYRPSRSSSFQDQQRRLWATANHWEGLDAMFHECF